MEGKYVAFAAARQRKAPGVLPNRPFLHASCGTLAIPPHID
jgi:hypothetical protein